MKKNTENLTTLAQVSSSIEYFARREATFRDKADAERTQLRDCVVAAVTVHGMTESDAARLAGVTRMTVRAWLGK